MPMLKKGDKGNDVKRIQEALSNKGFNPGDIDGAFGPATEAAVKNFQLSEGLLADGIVGPKTTDALFGNSAVPAEIVVSAENVIGRVTTNIVTKMFEATQTVKRNIEKYLSDVLQALSDQGLTDTRMVLMALATIRAETAGFVPIDEGISKFNTSPGGHPFDLYDDRSDLRNKGRPDGENFKGRGFIQLTGRFNYTEYSKILGLGDQLVRNPANANDPLIASKLLALFIKDKELKIKDALMRRSFKEARKAVNGGIHGITAFTNAYIIGEKLLS